MYKRTKKSAIVFTSSVSGLMPMPGLSTYSATKAFIRYMSESLKVELKNRIDVLNYAPGHVDTKMLP
jgi:short-subunit dehydrogenase